MLTESTAASTAAMTPALHTTATITTSTSAGAIATPLSIIKKIDTAVNATVIINKSTSTATPITMT